MGRVGVSVSCVVAVSVGMEMVNVGIIVSVGAGGRVDVDGMDVLVGWEVGIEVDVSVGKAAWV